jgi:hypothetical protein
LNVPALPPSLQEKASRRKTVEPPGLFGAKIIACHDTVIAVWPRRHPKLLPIVQNQSQ